MSAMEKRGQAQIGTRVQRKWWVLGVGAVVCLLCWVALGVGIAMEVGFTATFVLATLAAASTEGLIWLGAVVLGMRAFEVRRQLMQRIRALAGMGEGYKRGGAN